MIFNDKLKYVRDKKINLVSDINKCIDRLEQIEFVLGTNVDGQLKRPQLKLEEIPEK